MKGCLILQRRFAHLGHIIATDLKKKYGVDDFCAYVYLRASYDFLLQQKDLSYTTLLYDDEIHNRYLNEKLDLNYLRYLEKEFGLPNLWPYLTVDRILMHNQLVRDYPYDRSQFSHEELLRLIQVHAKAVIEMLEREKPDFIFYSVAGTLGSMLLYHIAKKFGVKTFCVIQTGIKERCLISESFDHYSDVEKIFQAKGAAEHRTAAEEYLNQYRQNPQSYLHSLDEAIKQNRRWHQLKFLRPKHFWRSLKWFGQILKMSWRERHFHDYSSNLHPWHYIVDRLERKLRNLRGLGNLYDTFDPQEDFVFFPLQYEPEVSLSLHAPFYSDQIYVIEQLAKSLPIHYKLYIKEHPAMVEFRPRSFYRRLKKIHNVKLINPAIRTFSILPHAKLIAVISGTIGWEALLLKKPVISFGNQYYNVLSMVKKCTEIERLPYLVKEQLENFRYNEEELISFISAIFQDSTKLDLNKVWYGEVDIEKIKTGLIPLTDLLAKKLGLKKV